MPLLPHTIMEHQAGQLFSTPERCAVQTVAKTTFQGACATN